MKKTRSRMWSKIFKILLSMIFFVSISIMAYSDQETIVSSDSLNQAWTKQNSMNTELYSLTTPVTLTAQAQSGGLTVNDQVIDMLQVDTDNSGWLSYTDWNTFNSKQDQDAFLDDISALGDAADYGLFYDQSEGNVVGYTLSEGLSFVSDVLTLDLATTSASGGLSYTNLVKIEANDTPTKILNRIKGETVTITGPWSFANIHLAAGSITNAAVASEAIAYSNIVDWFAYDTIPIAWMNSGTSEPDDLTTTARPPYAYRTFASDADEDLNFVWFVPSDLSGSTIQYRVKYLVTAATGPSSEGVAFGLSGVSLGDNDSTNGAKGTVVVVTDPTITAAQWDVLITGWSGDVTITNLAAGEVAELAFIRDVSDAADDYGQLVGVFAVEIRYVRDVQR